MKRARLDKFISTHIGINRRDVRGLLAEGRVVVDGMPATDIHQVVHQFSRIECDGQLLQANRPQYVMLHKPKGVVSATRDDKHKTAIELLNDAGCEAAEALHIAGRLDLNSTGLLLLTNNGDWSSGLSLPGNKVPKRYRVTLAKPLSDEYVQAFAEGMYFDTEGITTSPAQLTILDEYLAEVVLEEGRYHQIKRMFGRFRNEVLALHREAIGEVTLGNLAEGQYRLLTELEVTALSLTIK